MNKSLLKIQKRDIRDLYATSYPTLRRWFKRNGLAHLIGRRKLLVEEVLLIFKALGKPILARRASLRLQRIYEQVYGIAPSENPHNPLAYRDFPAFGFDRLPDSPQEIKEVKSVFRLGNTPHKLLHQAFFSLREIAMQLYVRKQVGTIRQTNPSQARAGTPRELLDYRASSLLQRA